MLLRRGGQRRMSKTMLLRCRRLLNHQPLHAHVTAQYTRYLHGRHAPRASGRITSTPASSTRITSSPRWPMSTSTSSALAGSPPPSNSPRPRRRPLRHHRRTRPARPRPTQTNAAPPSNRVSDSARADLAALRRAMQTEQPFGQPGFIEELEAASQSPPATPTRTRNKSVAVDPAVTHFSQSQTAMTSI
jgi:hypothetical protein